MVDKIKEVLKDLGTGLLIMAGIFAVVFGYGTLITMGAFSENVQSVLLFTPIIIYCAYMMGGLRRLNSKS